MSAKLYNLARMTTATTGTGTITLGSAVSGYLSFAGAGVANSDIVSYGIQDGSNSEVGTGTYTTAGTTLTRTVTKSTNSNTAISLSGTAQVFVTARAEDLSYINNATLQASPSNPTGTTSTTAVMMGLGGTCTITPVYTGRIKIEFIGQGSNTVSGDGWIHAIRWGTGTAPVNGAALTGTQVGTSIRIDTAGGGSFSAPMANSGIVTGLTPATAYWLDIALAQINGGTATILNVSCNAFEF